MFQKNTIRCGSAALLTVCLMASALLLPRTADSPYAMQASAGSIVTEGDLQYELGDNWQATVVGCAPFATEVVIPEELQSFVVVGIASSAFQNCDELESVTIPDSIVSIGAYAFQGCSALTTVNLPSSIESIGAVAFRDCTSLTAIHVPDAVTTIPYNCFDNCPALEDVTLGASVNKIEIYAFRGCSSLTAVEIPAGVSYVTTGTFANCTALASVTLPERVTNIGDYAFSNCTSLETIALPSHLTDIGLSAFAGSGLTAIEMPNTVAKLDDYAFSGCTSLETAVLSHNLTTLSPGLFKDCTALKSVHIPYYATSIQPYAFAACTSLETVLYSDTKDKFEAIRIDSGNDLFKSASTIRYLVGVIVLSPQDCTVTEPQNAKFSVITYGSIDTYRWQFSSDNGMTWMNVPKVATDLTLISIPVTKANNGYLYRCKTTDCHDSIQYSEPARLTVRGLLAITQQTETVYVDRGTLATFTVGATGDGLVYQWQYTKNNGASWGTLTGETTNTYSVKAVTARNGFAYRCRVTDQYGNKVFSQKAKLILKTEAAITQQPSPVTAFRDTTAQFSVKAVGDGLVYQWQYTKNNGASWGNLTGETTDTYSVKAVAARNGFCYRCRVTDQYGNKVFSKKVKLTVISATTILTQPEPVLASVGTTATFSVEAIGKGLTYQWQYTKNNGASWGNLTGETSTSYSVKATNARNGFCYRVRIMDADGNKVFSQKVKLTVVSTAMIDTQPKNVLTSVGKTATFSVAAYGDSLTYQWQYSKNGGETWGNLTGETTDSYSVKAVAARNGFCYRVRVTDRAGNVVISNLAFLAVLG